MEVMSAPGQYCVELQQRATWMTVDSRKDAESSRGAIKQAADQLGVHPEALRNWFWQAEVDDGLRPGTTTEDASRIAELENRDLCRANEILCTSAAFFAAAELDRKMKLISKLRSRSRSWLTTSMPTAIDSWKARSSESSRSVRS